MQLMDIHVCQEFSARLGRAVGNELREFVLNVALHIPGVVGVCAVTRTRGFRAKQRVTGVRGEEERSSCPGCRVVKTPKAALVHSLNVSYGKMPCD